MKNYQILLVAVLLCSCVDNPLDSGKEQEEVKKANASLMTRSLQQEDSLTMLVNMQSDVNDLMMSRIILKDSVFVLGIKKNDALFLGISEDVYDSYMDYVDRLNEHGY